MMYKHKSKKQYYKKRSMVSQIKYKLKKNPLLIVGIVLVLIYGFPTIYGVMEPMMLHISDVAGLHSEMAEYQTCTSEYSNTLKVLIGFFLIAVILSIKTPFFISIVLSLFIIQKINKINLRNDLNIWSLRIFGTLLIAGGIIIFFASVFTAEITGTVLINPICIIVIGSFSEYRALRRHRMIRIWH